MAAFPGFILAFFTVPNPPVISVLVMYLWVALYMLVSLGLFFVLDGSIKVTTPKITTLYGAFAFSLFYWFVLPNFFRAVSVITDFPLPPWLAWLAQGGIVLLTVAWVVRSYTNESLFVIELMDVEKPQVATGVKNALRRVATEERSEVMIIPNQKRIVTESGRPLLEIAESNSLPIEAGCRMGVCGADPVVILEGMDNLSACTSDEKSTLERLGLGANCRMACQARVNGPVSLTFDLEQASSASNGAVDFAYNAEVRNVVIV